MIKFKANNKLSRIVFSVFAIWIVLISFSYIRNTYTFKENILMLALNEARTNFNKDVLYRKWSAQEGGVYVKTSERIRPNPYLKVPNRDIKTENGDELTLVNPAYMTRLVHELEEKENGVTAHITSLNPIRKENQPDAWEIKALNSFENGAKEFYSIENINGKVTLRFMSPLLTEKACLNCHEVQGYKVGQIRGGISVSVPYEKYLEVAKIHKSDDLIFHLSLLLIGLVITLVTVKVFKNYNNKLQEESLKLKESEERFKFLADSVSEGILIHDDGIAVDVNKAFTDIFSYSKEEIVGKNVITSLVHPDDIPLVLVQKEKEISDSYEIRGVKKDGTNIFVALKGYNVIFSGRKLRVVSITNLTERKKQEAELIESEEKFRILTNNLPIGVSLLDKELNVLAINSYLKKIFPFKYESKIYKCFNVFNSESQNQICSDCNVVKTFNDGKTYSFEREIKINGVNRFFQITSSPIFDVTGNVSSVIEMIEDVTERKYFDEKLKESEERHRLLADNSSDVIWTMDKEGKFTYVSPSVEKLRGYTPEEVMKQTPEEVLSPSSLIHYMEGMKEVNKAIQKGERFPELKAELEQPCKNGSTVWTEATITGIYKANNEFVGILGVTRNISERKIIENALREAEAKYRSLINNSQTIIYSLNPDKTITFISPSVFKLLGYNSENEIIGKDFLQLIVEDDAKKVKDYFDKTIVSAELESGIEYRIFHKDGTLRWHKSIITNVFDDKENLISLIGNAIDITEMKYAEISLRESKIRYDLLAEQSRTVNWEVDINGLYTYVSQVSEQIWGYKPEELVGKKHFYDISPQEFAEKIKNDGLSIIRNKETILNFENPIIAKDGKTIWVLSAGMPILDESKKIIGYRGSDTDISNLKETEEELKNYLLELERINEELIFSKNTIEDSLYERNVLVDELEKAKLQMQEIIQQKDKFFSIIAHDLKSPFQGLLGLAQIISEDFDKLSLHEIQEYTSLLKTSADGIYKLLENLLEWARLQRDLIVFEPSSINVYEIIKSVLNTQHINAKKKKIEIVNNVDESVFANADVNMVNTIIRNLISNAVKFTKPNGSIEINSQIENDVVEVSVKDTGIGIPNKILDELFNIDVKNSRPGTEGEASTGLGLILSKEYVEMHNGKLWVESEVNVGSTFSFTLPINS